MKKRMHENKNMLLQGQYVFPQFNYTTVMPELGGQGGHWPLPPIFGWSVNPIQWCRKVKNFGGASSNRLGVSWFVKYWRGQWPPLPPSSGITENYPYLLPLAPPIFFIFRHHCTRKLDHAFHSAFYEIFNSYYYDSTQSKVYTSGI